MKSVLHTKQLLETGIETIKEKTGMELVFPGLLNCISRPDCSQKQEEHPLPPLILQL